MTPTVRIALAAALAATVAGTAGGYSFAARAAKGREDELNGRIAQLRQQAERPAAAVCAASDLEVAAVADGAAGSLNVTLKIATKGSASCQLAYVPAGVELRAGDASLASQSVPESGLNGTYAVSPGNPATLAARWSGPCGTGKPVTFRLVLPGDAGYLDAPLLTVGGEAVAPSNPCGTGIPTTVAFRPIGA